jgi:hypothetical protein
MIGEILAGVSALSSLFGSLKSAQANQAIDSDIARQRSELQVWYDKEYNQNYLQSDKAKSTIEILRRQMEEQMKKVAQNNAITGASDERRVAMADRLQKGMADNTTRLAGYGTRYKDMIRREYQGLNQNLNQVNLANLERKSDQWSNFMNNALNAGIGFAQASDSFKGWEDQWKKRNILNNAGGMLNPISTSNITPRFSLASAPRKSLKGQFDIFENY